MDNLTINRAQSPSFGMIKWENGLYNNSNRKLIVNHISKKLNEVNPNDKAKRSFVERAENYGYNIFFTKTRNKNAVRVDVVSTLHEEQSAQWGGVPFNKHTHVGTYTKPEQFDIQHFNNKYNPQERVTRKLGNALYAFIGGCVAMIAWSFGYLMKNNLGPFSSKPTNPTTIVAQDSAKIDSVKPIIKDAFKIGKKVIKK